MGHPWFMPPRMNRGLTFENAFSPWQVNLERGSNLRKMLGKNLKQNLLYLLLSLMIQKESGAHSPHTYDVVTPAIVVILHYVRILIHRKYLKLVPCL